MYVVQFHRLQLCPLCSKSVRRAIQLLPQSLWGGSEGTFMLSSWTLNPKFTLYDTSFKLRTVKIPGKTLQRPCNKLKWHNEWNNSLKWNTHCYKSTPKMPPSTILYFAASSVSDFIFCSVSDQGSPSLQPGEAGGGVTSSGKFCVIC